MKRDGNIQSKLKYETRCFCRAICAGLHREFAGLVPLSILFS